MSNLVGGQVDAPEWKRLIFMVGTAVLLFPILVGAIASSENQRSQLFQRMRREHIQRLALQHRGHRTLSAALDTHGMAR